jgi:hypothetical protein
VPDAKRQREIDHVTRLFDAGGRDVLEAIESALKQYPGDAELTDLLTGVQNRTQDATAAGISRCCRGRDGRTHVCCSGADRA